MKPMRIALPLVLAALGAFLVAGCGGSDQAVSSNSVAVVDGTDVTRAELDALISRAKKSYVAQKKAFPKVGTSEYQGLQTQAVAYLVQRAEYELEAKKMGIDVSDKDIDARIAEIKKSYFNGSQKKLDSQLAKQGYDTATFRADIRSQLISEKLYDKVTGDVTVSDADAKKYYDANSAQYKTPESREVRHILIAVNKDGVALSKVKTGGDTKIDYAKSQPLAEKVYEELENGADFAALAKKDSQDPGSKANGGKLTISRGQTVAPFDRAAFLLKTDEISKPIKTEYGYHLIQPVGEIVPAKTTPFASAKASIKTQLSETKKQEAIQAWAAKTKDRYDGKVTYASGYEPPSTSTSADTTTAG